ncbi:MAG: topoisomerase DNA-binding C4 zinc finger domain-containing protein [Candidatus Zixiibacteriota bacterium]
MKQKYIALDVDFGDSRLVNALIDQLGYWAFYGWLGLMSICVKDPHIETRTIAGEKVRGLVKSHSLKFLCDRLGLPPSRTARLLSLLGNYRSDDGQPHLYIEVKNPPSLSQKSDREEAISTPFSEFFPAACNRLATGKRLTRETLRKEITLFWPKLLKHHRGFYENLTKFERLRETKGNINQGEGKGLPSPLLQKLSQDFCPECQKQGLIVKEGSRGQFVSCSRYPECDYSRNLTPQEVAGDPSYDYPKLENPPESPPLTPEEQKRADEARAKLLKTIEHLKKKPKGGGLFAAAGPGIQESSPSAVLRDRRDNKSAENGAEPGGEGEAKKEAG